MKIEKSCLFCQWFNFSMGEPGYSEYTPGCDSSFDCMKVHWSMSNYGDKSEFVANLKTAEKCNDFEVDPKMIVQSSNKPDGKAEGGGE